MSSQTEDRLARYQYAIQETLRWVPADVQPVIVENNGVPIPALEGFHHAGKCIPVYYTNSNETTYHNKGVNELLDMKDVIERIGMKDDDIVIKLTGRYRVCSPLLFETIVAHPAHDVWMKFFDVCRLQENPYDCVLGYYGMRVQYIRWMSPIWVNLFESPEQAVAKYVRSSISANRIYECPSLGVECLFSEDGRILNI